MIVDLAQQWPVLALVLAIMLGAGRVLQQQYETRIKELREDLEMWRDLALSGTAIAESVTRGAERESERRR